MEKLNYSFHVNCIIAFISYIDCVCNCCRVIVERARGVPRDGRGGGSGGGGGGGGGGRSSRSGGGGSGGGSSRGPPRGTDKYDEGFYVLIIRVFGYLYGLGRELALVDDSQAYILFVSAFRSEMKVVV
jgi:hypothetical protein